MKPTLQNTKPNVTAKKNIKCNNHPDDEKKMDARRRIEDIEAQRAWEKEWGDQF